MRQIILLALVASAAFGQEPVWRVMAGDDPAFARPDFDDSRWAAGDPLRAPANRSVPAKERIAGVQWYRATFPIPEAWGGQSLAVGMGPMPHAYEVYVEGVRVGQFGSWLPKQVIWTPRHQSFEIPAALSKTGPVHVAIRRFSRRMPGGWSITSIAGGNRYLHRPTVGPAGRIAETERLHGYAGFTQQAPNVLLLVITGVCGLLCLGFYASQRRQREFLWLGVGLTARGLACAAGMVEGTTWWFSMFGVADAGPVIGANLIYFWMTLCLTELIPREALNLKRFLFFSAATLGTGQIVHILLLAADSAWYTIETGAWFGGAYLVVTLWAAARCFRAGLFESATLCATVAVADLAAFLNGWTGLTFQVAGIRVVRSFLVVDPFQIDLLNAASAATGLAMTFVLWRRYLREQVRITSLDLDLQAARTVQQLLFTGDAPGVEAVYQPASEVGGDFYQVLPLDGGARLIAVGDVSGKGLKAAMVVSMVVALLRNNRALSPGCLLSLLSRELRGTLDGGFVTCLLVRQEADGRSVIANAGHLAPYAAGVEVAVEAGLPLGIAETEYGETTGRFDSLMLLSDGVVEAAKADGELFGFERTREMSGRSAGEIAEAAQAWGQNDDITVVTVRRSEQRRVA
jgi:sigma-B regulation protein RsbU (phosphoserine phosphatase)